MHRTIRFEKWINPLAAQYEDEDEGYKDSYEQRDFKLNKPSGPVLVGNLGVILLNESNDASKIFNFWMAHCNFELTNALVRKIESVPGVESLDIFTRYRFRFSIGKAFDEIEVKSNIQRCVQPPAKNNLDILKEHLKNKYNHWAIIVNPEGETTCIKSHSKKSLDEQINLAGSGVQVIKS